MRRARILMAVAMLVAAVAAASASTGSAAGRSASAPKFTCAVGQAPARGISGNLGGGLRISDQVDVGCGRFGRERVAVVGYLEHFHGHRQLCFNLERRGSSVGIACEQEGEPWFGQTCPAFCLSAYPDGATPDHPALRTLVGAVAPLGTNRALVRAGAGARAKSVVALVVPVEGALLEGLGEYEPVVLAAAVLGGCYRARGVRLVATDADGAVLARERGRLSFPGQCRTPNFPPAPERAQHAQLR